MKKKLNLLKNEKRKILPVAFTVVLTFITIAGIASSNYGYVDKYFCIGCMTCVDVDSEDFQMNDNSIAFVRHNGEIRDADLFEIAKESCPMDAIHYTF
ncbi:MAG: ferredoxin [Bacteroidales bacterium]|jgi:ferredoxin|nr:ferredoxin [Bacteroidales bacterium]